MFLTLNELLLHLAQDEKNQIYFWQDGSRSVDAKSMESLFTAHSYKSIFQQSMGVAAYLRQQGLQKGDRVAIVLPTHPHFLYAFFGVLLAGGVPSALYPPLRLGKLDEWKKNTALMIQILSAKMILSDKKIHPFLGAPLEWSKPPFGIQTMESLLNGYDHLQTAVELKEFSLVGPEDFAFIQFSSGSTGKPKPVAITHQNVLANARTIVDWVDFPLDDPHRSAVSWLPLYHDMGLVGGLISSMVGKAPLLLLRPEQFLVNPVIWLKAMTQFKAGVSVAPNFAFGLCAKKIKEEDLKEIDLSHWKVALCGAETIHPHTFSHFIKRFEAVGFNSQALTPVYGLAEATLAVTFTEKEKSPEFREFSRHTLESESVAIEEKGGIPLACLGHPISQVSVEIRNEDNQVLPSRHLGRVWVKGPSIMHSYLNDPEETNKAIQDGWLDTGDRGFIYQDQLFLYGRFKEIIIHRGKNYDPSLLERAILEVEGLRPGNAVAIGHFDQELDTEKIVILAELQSSAFTQTHEEIIKKVKQLIQNQVQLIVHEVVLLNPGTLPKTSSGKLKRREAKELYLNGKLLQPKKVNALFLLGEIGKGIVHHWLFKLKRPLKHFIVNRKANQTNP